MGVFAQTYRYLQKSKDPSSCVEELKQQWAHDILGRLRLKLQVVGEVSLDKSLLYVGNHISYLDIAILLRSVPGISFVAKHEISSWPVFGKAAQKIETVFVKREDGDSRKSARKSIHEALDRGQRVAIFPSGTTCITEKKPWKKGAFEIAHEQNHRIQPFRITYNPLRAAAYIDRDFFPVHLYSLFALENIEATIEFHEPVNVTNPLEDCRRWCEWARKVSSPA